MVAGVDMAKWDNLKNYSFNTTKILLLLFIVGFSLSSFAQTINVSGKVTDNENSNTLPGATVMLLHPKDSTFYKFGITNPEGVFIIKGAEAGNYIFQVSFIGYTS